MRIIFAGTPDFSVPALKALIKNGHDVIAVYTQPDRKKGRGQKIIHSPVKALALDHNIQILQPISLKSSESLDTISAFNADLMIVVAYGMILPKQILEAPRYGCLNIHASLLPRWRGAAPIQRAIQKQDNETGICIMQMDVGLDTGDILHVAKLPIEKTDTSLTLHNKLSELGAEALIETLASLETKQKHASPQNHSVSTYAEKLSKAEAKLSWKNTAAEIDCAIRAFNPWPVCESSLNGERIRIWMSLTDETVHSDHNYPAGQVISIEKNGIKVACKKGFILLTKLQKEGGQPLDALEFANGFNVLSQESINTIKVILGT